MGNSNLIEERSWVGPTGAGLRRPRAGSRPPGARVVSRRGELGRDVWSLSRPPGAGVVSRRGELGRDVWSSVPGDGRRASSLCARGADRCRRKEEILEDARETEEIWAACFAASVDSTERKGGIGFRVTNPNLQTVVVPSLAGNRINPVRPRF
ncbi:unnamed protein product [Linum trigynum]|uniref:Uncharacterized protein n=1 Tax=Linum trigynum TaxID=586398 RepID=A0AAV2E436_9ROSI